MKIPKIHILQTEDLIEASEAKDIKCSLTEDGKVNAAEASSFISELESEMKELDTDTDTER